MQSFIPVVPGIRVKLSIVASEPDTVIEVDQAIVRWAIGQEFGLEFAMIAPEEFEKLTRLIQQLPSVPHRG